MGDETVVDNESFDEDPDMKDPFNGKSFQEILQEAAKIKGKQMEKKRKIFESWPEFLKRTFTHHPQKEFEPLRRLPAHQRILKVEEWKASGNDLFKSKKYEEARHQYERALSLIYYVKNNEPGWRKKGIFDEDLEIVSYLHEDDEEDRKRIRLLKIKLLINLGLTLLKAKKWALAKEPLDCVIECEPENAKALYFRSKVLSMPPSSGSVEHEMAIADLERACRADPSNEQIRRTLAKMKSTMEQQRKLDRKTFGGLFRRGQIVDDAAEAKSREVSESKRNETSFRKRMEELRALEKTFEAKGMEKEANELRAHLNTVANQAKRRSVDFSNPTKAMIDDAKKFDLDLTDPTIQRVMQEMDARRKAGETVTEEAVAKRVAAGAASGVLRSDSQSRQRNVYWFIVPAMIAFVVFRLYRLGIFSPLPSKVDDAPAEEDAEDPFLW